MANLSNLLIKPPYLGLNTVAPPGECPPGTAPLVNNFLTGFPDKLITRGPIWVGGFIESETLKKPFVMGVWTKGEKTLVGYTAAPASELAVGKEQIPWWQAQYAFGSSSERELKGEGNRNYNIRSNTSEAKTGTAETSIAGRGATVENYIYGFASWNAENETVRGYRRPKTKLLKWDGTIGNALAEVTEAPRGGMAVKSHLNRLWVFNCQIGAGQTYWQPSAKTVNTSKEIEGTILSAHEASIFGGIQVGMEVTGAGIPAETKVVRSWMTFPGGTTTLWHIELNKAATATATVTVTVKYAGVIEPNLLTWSINGGPVNGKASDWQDESSGLINKILVANEEGGNDFGVAMAEVGRNLILFKRHSIWQLVGESPETFTVQNITRERGCIDPWSVCEVDQGVYFLSQNGVEFFDGSEFHDVDAPVENITKTLGNFLCGDDGERTSDIGRCTISYLGNNYLIVSFTAVNPRTRVQRTSTEPQWTALYNISTGTWSTLTSGGCTPFQVTFRANGITYGIDQAHIYSLGKLTDPQLAELDNVKQLDIEANLITFSKEWQIPAKYITDRIDLASPPHKIQFHRVYQDYRFPAETNDAAETETAWKIKLTGPSSSETYYEKTLPTQGKISYFDALFGPGLGATGFMSGRRWNDEFFAEGIDVRVTVTNSRSGAFFEYPNGVDPGRTEVYATGIEYQVTGQRHKV